MTELVMYRGDDRDFAFTVTKDGTPLSLTGATVVFTAREALDDTTATFDLSSATVGEITIDADQVTNPGDIIVHVPAAATSAFTDGVTLFCDVQVTDSGGEVFTWPEALADSSALIRLKVRLDVTHA